MLEVDKKQQGYFSMRDLVGMLSKYKFRIDKQKYLLESFREIDHNADGFIPIDELRKYMNSMGEPLEDHEINFMLDLAKPGPGEESEKPDEIDIVKLSKLMCPSDDIMDDLAR